MAWSDGLRDACYLAAGAASAPVWGWKLWRTGKWKTDWRGKRGFVARELISPQSHGDTEEGESGKGSSRDATRPGVGGSQGRILLHAVSVGEVNLIRGLVDQLVDEGVEVVVSVTTDTGWATAQRLWGDEGKDALSRERLGGITGSLRGPGAIHVVRYPLDFSWMVERFLEAVRPDVVGLVELEVWPGFVAACQRRGIAVGVINGRLSERSYGRYALPGVAGLVRTTFGGLDFVAAQNAAYAERFVGLGVPAEKVAVLDTMKWDGAAAGMDDTLREQAAKLAEEIGLDRSPGHADTEAVTGSLRDPGLDADRSEMQESPRRQDAKTPRAERVVVLAGMGDEGRREPRVLEGVHLARCLVDEAGGVEGLRLKLIVVPRKPEHFAAYASGLEAIEDKVGELARRSGRERLRCVEPGVEIMLLDTLGELRACDALADAVIVGRSFNGWGGSDPMEAAGLGVPSVMGPDHKNFEAVVAAMTEAGGLVVEPTPEAAAARVVRWLTTENGAAEAERVGRAGKRVIEEHRGSTQRHAALLMEWLRRAKAEKLKS
ncbi:MAG: glycosyltransferase N-terminal domain-containing protein [Planctomycetota bacterium]